MTAPTTLDPAATEAFLSELHALGRSLRADVRPADRRLFGRIELAGRVAAVVGLATAWVAVNPVTVLLLAAANVIRWTVVAHHVLHGAFDRDPDAPARWKSQRFGQGWRRPLDWLDWIPARDWIYEHNSLHHHRLGESHDPDVPEEVFTWLDPLRLPRAARAGVILLAASLWRPIFYGPNSVRQGWHRARREPADPYNLLDGRLWAPWHSLGRSVWLRSLLPVLLLRFALLPALFLPLGPSAAAAVLVNLVLAELLANLHAFLIIVPSHAGDDVMRFDGPPRGRDEKLLRQLLGTANYRTGGVLNDVFHGYLNYQIEHHLWPELSPGQLVRAQPAVAELCARHGLPYRQEGVLRRLQRLWHNLLGDTAMPRAASVWTPQAADASASTSASA